MKNLPILVTRKRVTNDTNALYREYALVVVELLPSN
jgi:hypothetical protein